MRSFVAWLKRFGNLFNKTRNERDLADEIESNLQFQIEDNLRAGMSSADARRAALLKFGSIDGAKEAVRERRGFPLLEMFARDIAYAIRILRRDRAWTAVAVASLALAIGANTALFSVLNEALLVKLPVPRPDELVALRWAGQNDVAGTLYEYGYIAPDSKIPGKGGATFPHAVFERLRDEVRETADLFGFSNGGTRNVIVRGNGDMASCQLVSGNFYRALGISAELGRLFSPDDDTASADPVIAISHEYWQRRFGSDPSIVGTPVTINGSAFVVAGIVPTGFGDLGLLRASSALYIEGRPPDVWIPLAMEPRIVPQNQSNLGAGTWWLHVMGRVKPQTKIEQLQARLEPVFVNEAKEDWARRLKSLGKEPERSAGTPNLRVVPGSRGVYDAPPSEPAALTTLGSVFGILLMIVCVNLANLMLSRAAKRQREIAVRASIGASRKRLLAQLLTESVVLSAAGGAAGFLVAYWGRASYPVWLGYKPGLQPIDMNWTVIGFAAAITTLTGIIFGIVPAMRVSRVDSATAMRDSAGQINPSRSRLGRVLVVAQIALSLVLVSGAGLFLRTLTNLQRVDLGFNPNNILLFSIDTGVYQGNRQKRSELYDETMRRVTKIPGVRSIAFSNLPILSGSSGSESFSIEGSSEIRSATSVTVDERFFQTMEIPVRLGRAFTAEDDRGSVPVVIINESFAKEFFPNTNPIGKRLKQGGPLIEIIGVVGDIKHSSLRAPAPPTFYFPATQSPITVRIFEARTTVDPMTILPVIWDTVHQIDSKIPLVAVSTQMETIAGRLREERMFALSSSLFGVLALTISMIGLFGLMSYAVAQRTKEIGIRMSLGAQRRDILRSVLSEAMILVAVGIVFGIMVAQASTRWIADRLYGLTPHDPLTMILAAVLTIILAALAAYLPAPPRLARGSARRAAIRMKLQFLCASSDDEHWRDFRHVAPSDAGLADFRLR